MITRYGHSQYHKPYVHSEIRSEYHSTSGIKIFMGWRIAAMRLGSTFLIVDPYVGAGSRLIHAKITSQVNSYITHQSALRQCVTLHLGVKAGIAWQ